ncbi:MAG TPA: quinolinate synthase NadA [Mizugakiibacter sp.]|nr:quinolinate synthase NadA [Mizugakiibacter sp.]
MTSVPTTSPSPLQQFVPAVEWMVIEPLIEEIQDLKKDRKAVVLAHNYQVPTIYRGVADFTGDSLALARQAVASEAEVIVMAGVYFMAETAKILNPSRTVLIPSLQAGCSLADSITAEDVRSLRRTYPGVPVVSYVNTSAAVKAETDVCCTSANALQVVESLGVPRVIFLPDRYLGRNVAAQTEVELILWEGVCEVHEHFTPEQIRGLRSDYAGIKIVAHPECTPEVLAEADFSGSTSGMIDYVARNQPQRVALITECSMSDNVAADFPDVQFVRPCNLCPYMKRITLEGIRDALLQRQYVVEVDADIARRARSAVERMLAVGRAEQRAA